MHFRGFITSDPQRNAIGQSTEMSPPIYMLFRTFLNSLEIFNEIFDILVCMYIDSVAPVQLYTPCIYVYIHNYLYTVLLTCMLIII